MALTRYSTPYATEETLAAVDLPLLHQEWEPLPLQPLPDKLAGVGGNQGMKLQVLRTKSGFLWISGCKSTPVAEPGLRP
jgi:hypothetical protein